MAEKVPNQATVRDTQNFEIDIDKAYKDFISEIDSIRSIVNVSTPENESKLAKLNEQTIAGIVNTLKVETYPQESRCHAFYRIIGFPVINKSKDKMYNPGLDLVKDENKKTKADKIAIANNVLDGLYKISSARESYINKMRDVFALNKSVNASVLALSSSNTIRKFSSSVEKSNDPFIFKKEDSQYTMDNNGMIGSNRSVPLKNYVGADGLKPSFKFRDGSSLKDRNHIIFPFVVDPRIDFTVNPAKNLVAVPFVPTKSELKVNEIDFVRRPLLEKIIRERFSDSVDIGSANEDVVTYIKSIDSIKDENIIKAVTKKDGTYKLSEQLEFFKYLNIIRAMCKKLVEAQKTIEQAQSKYYWVPIPNTSGPEMGSDIYPVFLNVDSEYKTEKDDKILNIYIQTVINDLNNQSPQAESPDLGGFAFDSTKASFETDTSQAYGDAAKKSLTELTKEREQTLKKANEALRAIEIIVGEFSGFGLCDIIVIMGAMFVVPKEILLGFLDDDSFDRMKNVLKVTSSKPSIEKTYTVFNNTVKDLYNIMDKIYEDKKLNNA